MNGKPFSLSPRSRILVRVQQQAIRPDRQCSARARIRTHNHSVARNVRRSFVCMCVCVWFEKRSMPCYHSDWPMNASINYNVFEVFLHIYHARNLWMSCNDACCRGFCYSHCRCRFSHNPVMRNHFGFDTCTRGRETDRQRARERFQQVERQTMFLISFFSVCHYCCGCLLFFTLYFLSNEKEIEINNEYRNYVLGWKKKEKSEPNDRNFVIFWFDVMHVCREARR